MSDIYSIEDLARKDVIDIAKKHNVYFVLWDGHFGRHFVYLENTGRLAPNVYSAMYESYNDVVLTDKEVFRINVPNELSWSDILTIVKANLKTTRE